MVNWTTLLASAAFLGFLLKAGGFAALTAFVFAKPLITVGAVILFLLIWKKK